jgi:uncharacterized protein (UPF0332 family)
MEKAEEALASARLELGAGHPTFAVNRLYYSCFYAVTALLLRDNKQFKSHSAAKSEFVRSYIKSAKLDTRWSKFYQRLFDDRQEGDYVPTVTFDRPEIEQRLGETEEFLALIHKLIAVRKQ